MLLTIPGVLTPDEVSHARERLDRADWWWNGPHHRRPAVSARQGQRATPRGSSRRPATRRDDSHRARAERALHLGCAAVAGVPAALQPLPRRPLVSARTSTMRIRQIAGTSHRIRTDVSATLFLSAPDEYDGGELQVEDTYGIHSVKLPPGDLVLYPSTSLHHVRPVTPRRARGGVLLDSEHGARRRRAHAALRSGHRDSANQSGHACARGRPSRSPASTTTSCADGRSCDETISIRLSSGCTWPPASPRG